MSFRVASGMGLAAAVVFLFCASLRLEAPGLQYDEVYAAPASFAYVGQQPTFFVALRLGPIPLLNTTYTAAIKSGIYGLYLKISGNGFGASSWRLVGLLMASAALAFFCAASGSRLGFSGLNTFLLLLLTDGSVLLLTRYDWGSVALAMVLRLGFLCIWLRGELDDGIPARSSFWMGVVFGVAVLEKLSSVVLAVPMLAALATSPGRRSRSHWLACASGCAIGLAPLVLVNLWSYIQSEGFISLSGISGSPAKRGPWEHAFGYLSLGAGLVSKRLMLLGLDRPVSDFDHFRALAEVGLQSTLLLLVLLVVRNSWRQDPSSRLAGALVLSYFGIGAALYALPKPTWIYHWIQGTPLQYLAVALVMGRPLQQAPSAALLRWRRGLLVVPLLLLLALRLAGTGNTLGLLNEGAASPGWDPSFTQLGQFAGREADRAVFVASGWGVATQIYCLAGGQPQVVVEPFWSRSGMRELRGMLKHSRKPVLYLVDKVPSQGVNPEATARIVSMVQRSRRWREVAAEPVTKGWKSISIRKFVRQPAETESQH